MAQDQSLVQSKHKQVLGKNVNSSLLGWHLSYVDADADNFASLHSHGTGTLNVTAGTDTQGGVGR